MKINQNFMSKYLVLVCCVMSLVSLVFPFISITADVYGYTSSSQSYSALNAILGAAGTPLGYLLILGPIFLLIMGFIKKTEKYRGIAAIAVPFLCLVFVVILFMHAKAAISTQSSVYEAAGDYFDADLGISAAPKIGFFLMILSYIGTLIGGAVTYHGITLDKSGLDKIKADGTDIFKRASNITKNISFSDDKPENSLTNDDNH